MLLRYIKVVQIFSLILMCTVHQIECKRFGSAGSSRGKSSWGKSWGSSHKTPSYSKPNLASKPFSRAHRPVNHDYPHSVGLSGLGDSSHMYPPSSGLSGTGTVNHAFGTHSSRPNPDSSLSQNSKSHKYPVNSGLSGSENVLPINKNHDYPSSASGLSGHSSSASHSYPTSTRLSGTNLNPNQIPLPNRNTMLKTPNTHNYPHSTSLSGSSTSNGNAQTYNPNGLYSSGVHHRNPTSTSHTQNVNKNSDYFYTNTGSQTRYNNYGSYHNYHTQPSYFTSPQYVYVNEYRKSGSRFGDILTGLALYDFARSLNHHHHHYYYDDYYRRRYPEKHANINDKNLKDNANCTLKITENSTSVLLKIPCEIVSTFTDGSSNVSTNTTSDPKSLCWNKNDSYNILSNKKVDLNQSVSQANHGSVSENFGNSTDIILTEKSETPSLSEYINNVDLSTEADLSKSLLENKNDTKQLTVEIENTLEMKNSTTSSSSFSTTLPTADITVTSSNNIEEHNITRQNETILSSSDKPTWTDKNLTTECNSSSVLDPMKLKGAPVDSADMRCTVEIKTRNTTYLYNVNCETLKEYSKMPEPKKEVSYMPSRSKLESWLANPPWWMSLFIAV